MYLKNINFLPTPFQSMAPLAATMAFITAKQQMVSQQNNGFRGYHVQKSFLDKAPPPHRRNHNIISVYASPSDDEDTQSNNSIANDERCDSDVKKTTKSLSPLAMAAADWLEEEEDELAMYWDRYDVAKSDNSNNDIKEQPQQSTPQPFDTESISTEERLDRYYESRNIDRGVERKHSTQIKQAIENSKKASSASEAIQYLTPIRQYLQYNTKLGGNAYFELAQALDASDQDDSIREATDIYEKLSSSPHAEIRRKARELLAMGSSRLKRTYNKNVWKWFWDT